MTARLLLAVAQLDRGHPPGSVRWSRLGTVSYAAYLWNYPLTLWLRPQLDAWTGPVAIR